MTRFSRTVTAAVALLLLLSVPGHVRVQAQPPVAGVTGQARTFTALVSAAEEEVLLSVPAENIFLVTQACYNDTGSDYRLQNVGGGGTSDQALIDNSICQEYTPGIVYSGGTDVVFRNNGGTTVRVLINGVLTTTK